MFFLFEWLNMTGRRPRNGYGCDVSGFRGTRKPRPEHADMRSRAGRTVRPATACSRRLAFDLAADELLHQVPADVVAELLGRGLHEVGACRDDRAADAAVPGDLRRADRVDDDARRVRRVPHL